MVSLKHHRVTDLQITNLNDHDLDDFEIFYKTGGEKQAVHLHENGSPIEVRDSADLVEKSSTAQKISANIDLKDVTKVSVFRDSNNGTTWTWIFIHREGGEKVSLTLYDKQPDD